MQTLKLAFSQALFLVANKMQANKYLLKRGNANTPEVNEKKSLKVRNLREMCLVLANICEKLEKLVVVSEDPRMAAGK